MKESEKIGIFAIGCIVVGVFFGMYFDAAFYLIASTGMSLVILATHLQSDHNK